MACPVNVTEWHMSSAPSPPPPIIPKVNTGKLSFFFFVKNLYPVRTIYHFFFRRIIIFFIFIVSAPL